MGVSVVTTERLVLGGKVLTLGGSLVLGVLSILQYRQTANAAVARNKSNVYQDRDGVALSESSLSQRTGRLLWNTCLVVFVILGTGFASSQAYLFMGCNQGQENLKLRNLIQVGTWICFLLHSCALAGESTSPKRHTMARSTSICCVPVLILLYLEAHYGRKWTHGSDMNTGLTVAQAVVCMAIFGLGISLRRRPDVFVGAKMVDREYTCSLISQWTFSWPGYLVGFINGKDGITLDDLPVLGIENRAKSLLTKFARARDTLSNRMSSCPSLWRILMLANLKQVTLQFILTVLLCFVMFTPHFALMRLLQLLEPDSEALPDRTDLWVWIIAFGLLTSCFSLLDNWVHWICQNKVAIRIQEQLTIMIYDKAMRLGGLGTVPGDGGETTHQGRKPTSTSTQNMTNLIAVDAHRISKCAAILPRVATVPLRIVVACCILGHLLGWESFLAMVAILTTMVPLKFWCFRKYMTTEGDLMSQRDRRTSAVNEALRGIRQLKMSAMDKKWEQKIDILRTVELYTQRRAFTLATVGVSIQLLGSVMLSASALAIHAVFHGNLKSSVAFTALAILGSIDMILFSLPELIIEVLDAVVSLRRMDRFFQRDERVMQHIVSDKISFENVTVTWKQEHSLTKDRWALNGLCLDFPNHGLTVITGPTGSGKSLLLAAILGECDIIKGTIKSPIMMPPISQVGSLEIEDEWIQPCSMAYASQDPWIEAISIRANILFGLPFSGQRYHQVLFECALLQDLESMPCGDLTEVGNDGFNLSGGQKWRIALARVLYSRAGILILDDIFSAVDVHTSRHIYEHALTGDLAAGRTRVLVTHHLGLCLPMVDYIIRLQGGEAQYVGSVTELEGMGVLDSLLGLERLCIPRKADYYERTAPTVELHQDPSFVHGGSFAITERDKVGMRNVISQESRQPGAIKLSHVQHYIRKCSQWPSLLCVVACYFAYSGLLLARNWWVKLWSDNRDVSSFGGQRLHQVYALGYQSMASNGIDSHTAFFVSTYLALSCVAWVVGSMRGYILLMASLRASRAMFQELLAAVLRAPLRWIDTTPTGRIMNRFTSDFDMLDAYLGHDLTELLVSSMDCMVVLLPSIFASPCLTTVAIALLLLCVWYSRQYLIMAREMKGLESVARSPIYDQMSSSINGLWTIRAFGRTQDYIDRMQTNVDYHARALWQLWLLSRWLGFRMNMIGTLFCVVTAATVVFLGDADAALAGFVLGFTIQLTHSMTKAILAYACFELDMNGVERVLDYTQIKTEPSGGRDPPAAWPTEGRIEVSDLVVSYAPDMPPVIKGLNFQVESHQRVGVVGRTGAGKSSLALALFRLLEAKEGKILIDGIDISDIKLHHLRTRLAIIPQDPILFSGTIRSNLDPPGERTDNELLHALNEVHWSHTTQTPAFDILRGIEDDYTEGATAIHQDSSALDQPVSELGGNMSQGQRQLLCLARAAVSKPKVLVLDEATSAVDKHTDRLIQDSLKSSFHNTSTLLVIAHRLSTIVDYDRVLVLDAGQAVEFGHPADLMEIKGGAFRCMIDEDPERDAIKVRITRNSD